MKRIRLLLAFLVLMLPWQTFSQGALSSAPGTRFVVPNTNTSPVDMSTFKLELSQPVQNSSESFSNALVRGTNGPQLLAPGLFGSNSLVATSGSAPPKGLRSVPSTNTAAVPRPTREETGLFTDKGTNTPEPGPAFQSDFHLVPKKVEEK